MPTIAVFIDFENIYYTLQGDLYRVAPDGDRLARAFREIATRHGDMEPARAYADWEPFPYMMRAMDRVEITPVYVASKVLLTRTRKNSSDIEMTLDVAETLFTRPDIQQFVLFSGDGDFISVVERLKRYGKEVIVGALAASASGELLNKASEVIRLDDVLEIRPLAPTQGGVTVSQGVDNWEPLIEKLSRLQSRLPFVGFSYLVKVMDWQKLNPPLTTEDQQKAYMNRAREAGIIRVTQVPNPKGPRPMVSAVALNTENPAVQPFLERLASRAPER